MTPDRLEAFHGRPEFRIHISRLLQQRKGQQSEFRTSAPLPGRHECRRQRLRGSFVLANGNPISHGYSSDCIATRRDDALEGAVTECGFGSVSSGLMKDRSASELVSSLTTECHLEGRLLAAIAAEDTHGTFASLPKG